MSEYKPAPTDLELLNKNMDELARQVGRMDFDDPTRSEFIQELMWPWRNQSIIEIRKR